MSLTKSGGRTWEAAAAPGPTQLAKKYESALMSGGERSVHLRDYLPNPSNERAPAPLALLRVELAHRFDDDPGFRVEALRLEFPEVADDVLVALLYEELCLREELGEKVDPSEYSRRFPEASAALSRVLDIHSLVGAPSSLAELSRSIALDRSGDYYFPEAGQTIGGFHLVEELGKGRSPASSGPRSASSPIGPSR